MANKITQMDVDLIESRGFSHEYDWTFMKKGNIYSFENANLLDCRIYNEDLNKYWVDCVMSGDLPSA